MNTRTATRWVPRIGLAAVAVAVVVFVSRYGLLTVPPGMDTMIDTHPPGTVCLIDRRPASPRPGWVVFVDLPGGGTVLTRVRSVHADGSFEIRHDHRRSVFAGLEGRGSYPTESIRGFVLAMFVTAPQGEPGGW